MINLKKSLGIRLFVIAFLALALLIPSVLIQELISERENRRNSVVDEISQKWGKKQTVVGPVLSIPYKHYFSVDDKVEHTIRYAHFLPEKLNIKGSIVPEVRYRGIYKVIVYNGKLMFSGNFHSLDLSVLNISPEDYLLDEAFISVGISDMTGIKDFISINWDGQDYPANPGIETNDVLQSGISIAPVIAANKEYRFAFDLNLNGSGGMLFSPVGKQTVVELNSEWANPSFTGNFLPVEREVNSSGFRANWEILHLNRNFSQQWTGPNQEVSGTAFGVDLLLPVDGYQKTMRTAKYAIMFIALTFMTFFMIELLGKKVIHPVQYLLIGFALLLFYTLLLSISEYLSFNLAYVIAASSIIALITVYSFRVLSDMRKTGIILGVLILLYGFLYILLQLQDYALLMGSIGLFIVLSLVMYLTREIDWFEILDGPKRASGNVQIEN
ncbi:cell envelope integrity protein CreD [Balneolaceae bacterium YR4-1]|uniref:Cell envelope integrity protein CreD n=1 Tax=Halalkalibaculum roseum TaxID=2709311 RepID=A0A6M1SVV4_9BACT|nr:cell envelope integrity protein CreD [Halalkalibaculum roseum]NGP76258.1 cell envelope integrity protein CreD [Halalkalibaculum roseum]